MDLNEAFKLLNLNYYNDKNMSLKELERQYKRVARQYHPDFNMNLPEHIKKLAEEQFKKVNEAISIIREKYVDIEKENLAKAKDYFNDGMKYYDDKNYIKALELFQKAKGYYHQANLYIGYIFLKQDNIEQAIRYFRDADYYGIQNAGYELGKIYFEQNNLKLSLDYFVSSADKGNTESARIAGAILLKEEKDFEKAIIYIKKYLNSINEKHKEYPDICNRLGICYEQLKDYNTAEEWFEKSSDMNYIYGCYNYGRLLFKKGNKEEAIKPLYEAHFQGHVKSSYILGKHFLETGYYIDADMCMRVAYDHGMKEAILPMAVISMKMSEIYLKTAIECNIEGAEELYNKYKQEVNNG